MVLTNITKEEKKRFEKLQKEGMLPSEALRRLETERRLGTVPESNYLKSENFWYYVAGGGIAIAILYVYMKSPTTTVAANQSLSNNIINKSLTLDTLSGIDIKSLEICRKNGMI